MTATAVPAPTPAPAPVVQHIHETRVITLPRYGWLRTSEAAQIVGCSTTALEDMRARGEIPAWALLETGRQWRISAVWCAGLGQQPIVSREVANSGGCTP